MTPVDPKRLILQAIQGNQPSPGISVHDSVLAEKTGLTVQDVRDHLELLEGEDLVKLAKTTGGFGAWLTARGRLSLRELPIQTASGILEMPAPEAVRRLILEALDDGQGRNVKDSDVAQKSGLPLQAVRDHLDLLGDADMVVLSKNLDGTRSAQLKARGRLALGEEPQIVGAVGFTPPVEIQESLARFRSDHPAEAKTAFIMMRFGQTGLHEQVAKGIKAALEPHGVTGLRADDKQYHDDLFPNILTYIHGCGMGIAVFERIESDEFNPNVSLEVGYMMAMRRPVCLLKDKTLRSLPSDLVGRLYRPFDPQDPIKSIPPVLRQWLTDKRLG